MRPFPVRLPSGRLSILLLAALASITVPLMPADAASDTNAAASLQDSQAPGERIIEAVWHLQEIKYSYTGFTTAYDCDAAQRRIKNILLALGAHQNTKVYAGGCRPNHPSRQFFVTITTATPVAATSASTLPSAESEQKLLQRMGMKSAIGKDAFRAQWKTIELSRDRTLDLNPGDCELMEGLRDHVFPKLSVRVLADQLRCIPKQLDATTPELTVAALVALPGPDSSIKP